MTDIKPSRIASIDILRGFVILLMLVDHVRERFYLHKQVLDPMDINNTEPALFFTRLSAHLCAPIFVFLTGISAWLYANPSSGIKRSAPSFLFKRGLILILLEVTLINFSWFGAYNTLYLQVIWAIGLSMIVLAGAAYLPRQWIIAIGLTIVIGHNLLSPIQFSSGEFGYSVWTVLHDRGFLISDAWVNVKVSYPVLPWIGVIMLGYAVGPLFSSNVSSAKRKLILIKAGFSLIALLLILRGFNIYGETLEWTNQVTVLMTIMAFLNYTKYPPSLDFLLFSISIGALTLAWLETAKAGWLNKVNILGSAPMFFYILHLYILLFCYLIAYQVWGPNTFYGDAQQGYLAFDHIGQVWLFSAGLIFVLYWPSKKFSQFKRATHMRWVKYF
ncbi:DUF1624 domain-containing protein [Colwellia sp. Arc7-635]|uniref:DUF1624 domain-containing protein n=1 Tax=Colwellia sp. Arc7-635 TaxID=2497879 RepID=UPI000F856E98|nr:heparan-alpha-glucosaminide N-acetyltransferase domain-containing protein [Colwellia sp. Arc7-635]AZQ84345.1 DUF1624 domain-containing protein [Colwellia sp. Arc7-635]